MWPFRTRSPKLKKREAAPLPRQGASRTTVIALGFHQWVDVIVQNIRRTGDIPLANRKVEISLTSINDEAPSAISFFHWEGTANRNSDPYYYAVPGYVWIIWFCRYIDHSRMYQDLNHSEGAPLKVYLLGTEGRERAHFMFPKYVIPRLPTPGIPSPEQTPEEVPAPAPAPAVASEVASVAIPVTTAPRSVYDHIYDDDDGTDEVGSEGDGDRVGRIEGTTNS